MLRTVLRELEGELRTVHHHHHHHHHHQHTAADVGGNNPGGKRVGTSERLGMLGDMLSVVLAVDDGWREGRIRRALMGWGDDDDVYDDDNRGYSTTQRQQQPEQPRGLFHLLKELATNTNRYSVGVGVTGVTNTGTGGLSPVTSLFSLLRTLRLAPPVREFMDRGDVRPQWEWCRKFVVVVGGVGGSGKKGKGRTPPRVGRTGCEGKEAGNGEVGESYDRPCVVSFVPPSFMVGYTPLGLPISPSSPYLTRFLNSHALGPLDDDDDDDDDDYYYYDGATTSTHHHRLTQPEHNLITVSLASHPPANGVYVYAGRSDTSAGIWKQTRNDFALYECSLDDDRGTRRWYISRTRRGDVPGTQRDEDFYMNRGGGGGGWKGEERVLLPRETGWESCRTEGKSSWDGEGTTHNSNNSSNDNNNNNRGTAEDGMPVIRFQRCRVSVVEGYDLRGDVGGVTGGNAHATMTTTKAAKATGGRRRWWWWWWYASVPKAAAVVVVVVLTSASIPP